MGAWYRGTEPNSGGGHEIPTEGAGLGCAPDCPKCRTGTLVDGNMEGFKLCVDCRVNFGVAELVELGVLPRSALPRKKDS